MDTEVKKHLKAFAALCSLAMVFSIFSASALASDPKLIEIDQAYITDHGNKMPTERGDYILAEDISVSDTAQISEDRAVLSINLNGHTITYSGSGSVYIVGNVDKKIIRQKLTPAESPREIIFVENLPLNASGKVDKKILAENYHEN